MAIGIQRLMQQFDEGASSDVLCSAACNLLIDTLLPGEDDSADELRAATMAWRALEVTCRNAFRRYPAPSSNPDPRAVVLFETLTVARNAGLYEPAELAGANSTPSWLAGECLRLHALTIVLRAAARELERGTLPPVRYRIAVVEFVHRLTTAHIGKQGI